MPATPRTLHRRSELHANTVTLAMAWEILRQREKKRAEQGRLFGEERNGR